MTVSAPHHAREASTGHLTLAWPAAMVYDSGRFTGFLMPAADMTASVGLHRITNPTGRSAGTGLTAWVRSFTWRYLVATAANLAQATAGLHASGVVIGDFSDANVRAWDQTRVTLLDCDSMQITDPVTMDKFLCQVGRPEFTPPELARRLGGRRPRTVIGPVCPGDPHLPAAARRRAPLPRHRAWHRG